MNSNFDDINEDSLPLTDEAEDYTQIEEKFFENVRNGKKYQHFLNLSAQIDCFMIRSMLASMDIPTYTEGENVNNIYGGASTCLTSVFKIKLYILIEDYEEAFEVVKGYIKNKAETLAGRDGKDKYIKVFELLAAPYIISNSQEMLGIVVLPKKTEEEKKSKKGLFRRLFKDE
ncbi:MAG: hypothetical protein PUC37_12545 [Spirochaetales bacterium]|nr:hypothetical protein [Spirochaetales bacterium]